MISIPDHAIPAASAVTACAGQALESGLQAGPCCFCLRRSAYARIDETLVRPAVRWVESSQLVGYVCHNQVKTPGRGQITRQLTDS